LVWDTDYPEMFPGWDTNSLEVFPGWDMFPLRGIKYPELFPAWDTDYPEMFSNQAQNILRCSLVGPHTIP